MTYYIILEGESPQVIQHDSRIIGDSSPNSKLFYTHEGFKLFSHIINTEPEMIESLTILNENGKKHTAEQFIKILSKHRLVTE